MMQQLESNDVDGDPANTDDCIINIDSVKNNCDVVIDIEDVNAVQINEGQVVFDPYLHRKVKYPTSYFDTLIHLLKANLGMGILAMPSAFKNAGYMVGILGTIFITVLCTFTMHLLIIASHELCIKIKIPSLSYADTAAVAFKQGPLVTRKCAPIARYITNLFLVLQHMGTCCVLIVFISSNLKVNESYFGVNIDIRIYMSFLLLPLIAISSVRNLKLLAPFSSIATCMSIAGLSLIFYHIFQEMPSFDGRKPVGSIQSISLFFGTVLFAMESIGVILPLENVMKEPIKFGSPLGVLNVSMLPTSVLYLFLGLFGYLEYGESTAGSITLNVPQHEGLFQVAILLLCFSAYISYALSHYVAFNIVWKVIEQHIPVAHEKMHWEYGLRTLMVIVTFYIINRNVTLKYKDLHDTDQSFFLAVAIPNLEPLISLIGASCLSTVGIALPAIINCLTFFKDYQKKGRFTFIMFYLRTVAIVGIAVFAFIIGVSTSVSDILEHIT